MMRQVARKEGQAGFTLVELAIVLTIIGLVIGVILVGQNMIKSAKMSTAIADLHETEVALNAFRMKYNAIPGDFNRAKDYWPECVDYSSNPCNGNGDGDIIEGTPEEVRAWQHLKFAGLTKGDWTGQFTSPRVLTPGVNVPSWYEPHVIMELSIPDPGYGGREPTLSLELNSNILTHPRPVGPVMMPEDALSLDLKIDDGLPQGGILFARQGNGMVTSDCLSGTGMTSKYKTEVKEITCRFNYWLR